MNINSSIGQIASQFTGSASGASQGSKDPKALHKDLMNAGLSDTEAKGVVGAFKSASGNPAQRMEAAMSSAGISSEKSQSVLAALNGGKAKESSSNTSTDSTSTSTDANAIFEKLKTMLKSYGVLSDSQISQLSSLFSSNNSTSNSTSTDSQVADQLSSDGYSND